MHEALRTGALQEKGLTCCCSGALLWCVDIVSGAQNLCPDCTKRASVSETLALEILELSLLELFSRFTGNEGLLVSASSVHPVVLARGEEAIVQYTRVGSVQ